MDSITALFPTILSPCHSEDSTNCVWIAPESGNGIGSSFADIDGTAFHLQAVDSYEC